MKTKLELHSALEELEAELKVIDAKGTDFEKDYITDLNYTFDRTVGELKYESVKLEAKASHYNDISFQLNYKEPGDNYSKELMTVYFKGVNKNGKSTHSYILNEELPRISYKFERLSFYSTSGWDYIEAARCILIGRVVEIMEHKGDVIGSELFAVSQAYEQPLRDMHNASYRKEEEVRAVKNEINTAELETKMRVGVQYKVSHVDVNEERTVREQFKYGYNRYDTLSVRDGISYEIVRETATKYQIKFYNEEAISFFDQLKKKSDVRSLVRRLINNEKLKLTATNI